MSVEEYPNSAGHRGIDTSIAGAAHINGDLPRLQAMVRKVIAERHAQGATGNEAADALGWHHYRIRPRLSELRARGAIVDSGLRRRNASGVHAIVWILPEYEQPVLGRDVTGEAA